MKANTHRLRAAATAVALFFHADWSYYQPVVDKSYDRPWGTFRVNDGTFVDPHFAANFAQMVALCKRRWLGLRKGRVQGFTIYSVYEPGIDSIGVAMNAVHAALAKLTPRLRKLALRKITLMFDIESWGGRITGNHSPEITNQLNKAAGWLSHVRVIAYANSPDFSALFPDRPSWVRVYVARYSDTGPEGFPNLLGWQFGDGDSRYPVPNGYPRGTAPFGNCDMNVVGMSPEAFAKLLGVGPRAKPAPHPDPQPQPKPTTDFGPYVERMVDAAHHALKNHPNEKGPLNQTLHDFLNSVAALKSGGK